MGRRPTLEQICVDCGARDKLGAAAAQRAGWRLWIGGGRCPKCQHKQPQPPPAPLAPPAEPVYVRCSACDRAPLRGIEMTPGEFWPTFHWLCTDENKRALRERKVPLPLCKGIHKPGTIVKIESIPDDDQPGDLDAPIEAR